MLFSQYNNTGLPRTSLKAHTVPAQDPVCTIYGQHMLATAQDTKDVGVDVTTTPWSVACSFRVSCAKQEVLSHNPQQHWSHHWLSAAEILDNIYSVPWNLQWSTWAWTSRHCSDFDLSLEFATHHSTLPFFVTRRVASTLAFLGLDTSSFFLSLGHYWSTMWQPFIWCIMSLSQAWPCHHILWEDQSKTHQERFLLAISDTKCLVTY